jgi:muramoyltetrapeptide carboxypeptidase
MDKVKSKLINSVINNQFFCQTLANRTIKTIAPASHIENQSIAKLRTLKPLQLIIPKNLLSRSITYHANTDDIRFSLLKSALASRSSQDIIWALRGGYGSARLIERLLKLPKPSKEKLFIGFSDLTALHLFLSQQWQWKTIHGSVLTGLLDPSNNPNNYLKLAEIIAGKKTLQIEHLQPFNKQANLIKKIRGRLTGGNLSLIQTSIGTSWQIKSSGKIVFLEDTNEKGYQIDRMLNHLTQAGIFRNTKAIVFGDFGDDPQIDFALKRFALESVIPVFKTDQFGHRSNNFPLVYNSQATLIPIKNQKTSTLIMQLDE